MKKIFRLLFCCMTVIAVTTACDDNPIDEDGLLITDRDECYVSNFDLTGTDHLTVKIGDAIIDNEACTINITVAYGTDLQHLYPKFSLVTDGKLLDKMHDSGALGIRQIERVGDAVEKLEPKITGITDFSDLANPRRYTVISGSRRVRKTYTIYITVQKPV